MFINRRPLLTPSSSGRWTLSRTAWRGRRVGPRSLGGPYRWLEPFTRLVRALTWFRRFWSAARDLQHNWRAVRTLDARSCSSFWQFHSYVNCDVRQCSAWRVCTGSVLSLTAVNDTEIASRKGSVICQFLFKARQGDPEKKSR